MNDNLRIWSKQKRKFVDFDFLVKERLRNDNNKWDFFFHNPIGVLDKNGKTIFEEDIVENECDKFLVGARNILQQVENISNQSPFFCFYFESLTNKKRYFTTVNSNKQEILKSIKIIGNVYETPELLQK